MTSDGFRLDPRLAEASVPVATLPLCEVRLQDDARWPWLVLTPRRPGLLEIDDLPPPDRVRLLEEAMAAAGAVRAVGRALGRPFDKLNLGALGNVVAQLHVHVVGRRRDDPAWPGPVWGFGRAEPYGPEALARAREAARSTLT